MRMGASAAVVAALTLLGSAPSGAGGPEPPSGRAAVEGLLRHLPPDLGAGHRRLVEELLDFEAPLTPAAVSAAAEARSTAREDFVPLAEPCDPASLPLDVTFARYAISLRGRRLPGQGFSKDERDRYSRFLCRMLPILGERYGAPFQRWPITLVKDLRYSGSWIFIPSLLEIHSDGTWNPRLLTHEFIHAFRGRRGLTSDADWNYTPRLSGFEEGFAEGVAYLAMNDYVRRFCTSGDCSQADAPSGTFWFSYLEATYDSSNDASLTCEDFWSDYGGTLKSYERYLMAASAITRLETSVPGFSRRFNEEYYARIRASADYRPSRDAVIAIVEALSPTIDGLPARGWIDRQHIFDSRTLTGKRDWTMNLAPYSALDEERVDMLRFLETFPGGSEWAEYLPDCPRADGSGIGGWLYYRLHGTKGGVRMVGQGAGSPSRPYEVVMQTTTDSRVSGCNDVIGQLAFAELHTGAGRDCRAWFGVRPTCLEAGPFGWYDLTARWRNPQFGRPAGPPWYAMPYDAAQSVITTRHPLLAGTLPPGFDRWRHRLAGAVNGRTSGTVTITHSARPGTVVVPLANGAFIAEPPTCPPPDDDGVCWVHWYAPWLGYNVLEPGTLTFTVQSADGTILVEQRTVGLSYEGRHEFLLGR